MKSTANKSKPSLGISGFILLFLIYHLPGLFQYYLKQPLLLFFELAMLVFVIAAFLIGRYWHANGLKLFGLYAFRRNWKNFVFGLFLGILMASIANFIPVLLGWTTFTFSVDWTQVLLQTILIALGTLLPSLSEDILTRAYLKAFWPQQIDVKWLILLSALVFVLNHIFRLTKPDVMLYLFILGILLMWCVVETGTLWLTLGIHWGGNMVYQFFSNLLHSQSLRETGLENYILAACYAAGFLLLLSWKRFFLKGIHQIST